MVVVSICDAGTPLPASCVNDTIFITINPVNDAPIVDNETHTINEDATASGDLTNAGDSDPDGTTLTANTTPVVAPSHGSIVINSDGTYTYTPTTNYNGTDMVVVSICDAGTPLPASCVNDTIFITINPANDAPIVDNETHTINEDVTASGDLTDNGDSDADGNLVVTTTPVSGPNHGSIVVNSDGTYTYTPIANFNGMDTVVVTICDDGTPLPANCVNDTIFITVNPINDIPVIDNETVVIDEDSPATGDLTDNGDNDLDGNLVVNTTPASGPNHGSIVIISDGTYTYTPTANFNGMDTVVVTICDDGTPLPANCLNDTIFITVNPINDVPAIDNEQVVIDEDTPAVGDLTDNGDSDVDGNLIVNTTPVSGPNHGTIVINSDGTFTYTPTANFNGMDTVVVTICDDGSPLPANCVNDTVFITVNPINDVPVVDNENHTIPLNGTASGDLTNSGDTDIDGNLIASTTPVDGPHHGTIVINADGTYTYTPSTDYFGLDTVIVTICDDGTPLPANCVNDTIYIQVMACPSPTDTDGDGLTDCEETSGIDDPSTPAVPTGTSDQNNPCDPIGLITTDTDGDGLTDCEETTGNDDPSTPAVPTGTSDQNNPCDPIGLITTDTDGDGYTDCEEITGNDDPSTSAIPTGTSNPNDPCDPLKCVQPTITIPQAFSPDGDGINEAFEIEGIENVPNNKLTILNRWGNEVYNVEHYANDWKGTSTNKLNFNGDQLPTGTYYYIFDTQDEEYGVMKGYIFLQR
jgi:gliding motility-associated-like protein